ncbi:2-dehydro-3-deoxygalactonokinase, partial [Salmonella enterica]|uniref:2-dehydro-3-deoxygalactonokinase n=1 Tax=Salmonella enterica TaxID=28901 RepID=UPI003CF41867
HFDTFMTGEVYGALCGHTILGRTMQKTEVADDEAFLRGAGVARTAQGKSGVLSNIFSSRTLGLTGELAAEAQPDYLSGLLIGH